MTNAEFQTAVLERLDGLETRLDGLETRLERLETKMDRSHEMLAHLALGQTELKRKVSELESKNSLVPA